MIGVEHKDGKDARFLGMGHCLLSNNRAESELLFGPIHRRTPPPPGEGFETTAPDTFLEPIHNSQLQGPNKRAPPESKPTVSLRAQVIREGV